VLVPCPVGWGTASADTIRVARLATESGTFPVFEAVDGEVTGVQRIRRQVPVDDYLRTQTRFAHLFRGAGMPDVVARLQRQADRAIAHFGLLEEAAG
jgi:pyruvate ferredoxin oxidoreductase beta subunit